MQSVAWRAQAGEAADGLGDGDERVDQVAGGLRVRDLGAVVDLVLPLGAEIDAGDVGDGVRFKTLRI